MMAETPLPSPDYATWLASHKARIQSARAANRKLILLDWDLGRGIVEKQQALGRGQVGGGEVVRRSAGGVPMIQMLSTTRAPVPDCTA
jgi:hypothetical protein